MHFRLNPVTNMFHPVTRCLLSFFPFANIWSSELDFLTIKLTNSDMAFKKIDNNADRVWLNGDTKFLMFRAEQLLHGWLQGTNFWLWSPKDKLQIHIHLNTLTPISYIGNCCFALPLIDKMLNKSFKIIQKNHILPLYSMQKKSITSV